MSTGRLAMFSGLRRWWYQLISGYRPSAQPVFPADLFPKDFTVRTLSDTGVYVFENFCTREEAADIIKAAESRLEQSGVLVDNKFQLSDVRSSHTAQLFGKEYKYPAVVPLMMRAATMVGLPYSNIENVYVTRYREGDFYGQHVDFGAGFAVDRLYTVLVYLNDVDEEHGGATVFPSLRTAVQPRTGVAVSWTNMNPDGSCHLETNHAAYPVKGDGEKWAIQFWLRNYRVVDPLEPEEHNLPVFRSGERQALAGEEELPEGVSYSE